LKIASRFLAAADWDLQRDEQRKQYGEQPSVAVAMVFPKYDEVLPRSG
jgi:hypothetical protein